MKQITIKSALMRIVAVMLFALGTVSASAQYYMNVFRNDGQRYHFYIPTIDSINFASPFIDSGLTTEFKYERSGQNSTRNTTVDMKKSTNTGYQYLQWNFLDASDCSESEIKNNDYGNAALLLFYNKTDANSKYVDEVYKIKISELLDSADALKLRQAIANAEVTIGQYDDNVRDAILSFVSDKQNNDSKFYHMQIRDAFYGVANFIQNGPDIEGLHLGIPDIKVTPISATSASNYYTIDDGSSNYVGYNTNVRLYYDMNGVFYNDPNTPVYIISWFTIAKLLYNEYYVKFDRVYKGQSIPEDNQEETQNEYVDLGLSVKWATCNVGATKPEEYGDYFAWGETETKTDYSWSTYKWCNGTYNTMTKYCNRSDYGNNGFTDTKTTLDPEDDVAHVKWGGNWRMPTKAEQDDLRNKCTWTWYSSGNTEFNGIAGYKVTSNIEGYKDRFIFLPVAGFRGGMSLINVGSRGYYWSSSLSTDYPCYAWTIYINSSNVDVSYNESYRNDGRSVRPVCPYEDWSISVDSEMTLITGASVKMIPSVTRNNIEYDAQYVSLTWSSNNPSVATVSDNGEVTAVSPGTAVITASILSSTAQCTITVKYYESENGHECVDLGLSVKWATFNVGATKPEEYGDYYAWGETKTKTDYSWSTYKWCNGTPNTLTKYNTGRSWGITVDNKITLDPEDDVAHVKWGGNWRMPTHAEQYELLTNCTWTWTTLNGVNGYRVTSNKAGYTDRSIFLPAAGLLLPADGYGSDTSLINAGSRGSYWSSSLSTDYPFYGQVLYYVSDNRATSNGNRSNGSSVRPVCP